MHSAEEMERGLRVAPRDLSLRRRTVMVSGSDMLGEALKRCQWEEVLCLLPSKGQVDL